MTGVLPLNAVAGIRIRATTRDGSAWRAGHEAAWPLVRTTAAVSAMLALVALGLIALRHPVPAIAVAVVPHAVVLGSLVPVVRRARSAAQSAPPGD